MTLTRSQRGITPRKTEHFGMTETPGTTRQRSTRRGAAAADSDSSPGQQKTRGRPRKSVAAFKEETPSDTSSEGGGESIEVVEVESSTVESPKAPKRSPGRPRKTGSKTAANGNAHTLSAGTAADHKFDTSGHFEFGGTPGVTAIMIGFPLLMYYMWIGATYYNGKLPTPAAGQSLADFFREMGRMVYQGAFPSLKAWAIYWTFFIFEGACYILLPGVTAYGKPLPHLGGKQLAYHCSGMWSLYVTVVLAAGIHVSGVFKLYVLLDEFGPLLSVAILSGILVSVAAYVSAVWRDATHRMTGRPVYDFFMGAELNPRMFGVLDFKMFFEIRVSWYILLLTSASAAARQYERYGYVSAEVAFVLMAHLLYANACAKGEDLIPPTWDMYYEKWGFMLIFWNLAGVPLTYCHCTIYLANHHPSVYRHSAPVMALLFASYLFAYWVWDTANSQKNRFRQSQRGGFVARKAFPQLPWQHVTNPRSIPVKGADPILADGWYRYARKIHYTCDLWFAISWGLVCGFKSPFPWFYPVFFAAMIAHRAWRDVQRCRERYGDAWTEYERITPYLFIPYVF